MTSNSNYGKPSSACNLIDVITLLYQYTLSVSGYTNDINAITIYVIRLITYALLSIQRLDSSK